MIVTTDKNARRDDDEIRRYDVRLHFAEPEPVKPGQRIFSVSLEGRTVLENLDVVRAAGGSIVRWFASCAASRSKGR